jgi:hypothetical protein
MQYECGEATGSLEISDGVAESLSLHRICEARIDPQQLTVIRRYQIKREPLCSIQKSKNKEGNGIRQKSHIVT